MKEAPLKHRGGMSAEYDFSTAVRGKYVDAYRRAKNVRLLDPELAATFPDSRSVNDALRTLLKAAARAKFRKLR